MHYMGIINNLPKELILRYILGLQKIIVFCCLKKTEKPLAEKLLVYGANEIFLLPLKSSVLISLLKKHLTDEKLVRHVQFKNDQMPTGIWPRIINQMFIAVVSRFAT